MDKQPLNKDHDSELEQYIQSYVAVENTTPNPQVIEVANSYRDEDPE